MTIFASRVGRARSAAGEGPGALIRKAELPLAILAAAAGLYIFLSTVLMVVWCWTAIPYQDQWDNLILSFREIWQSGPLTWLFRQHNEHRIAVPRLLFAIDRFLFGTTNKFTFAYILINQLSLAALVAYLSGRGGGQRIAERIWIAGVAFALLFSAMQWENLLWGFQVQFVGVDLAALATFAVLGLSRPGAAPLTAVIVLASIAVYTLASGILVPFLAVPLALWLRWPKRHVVVLGAAALGLLASYLYGYATPRGHSDPIQSIARLHELFSYLLAQIGLPFGMVFYVAHIPHLRSWDQVCGAVGIVLFAVAAITMLRRRERGGAIPVLGATALFVIGMALLAALGRLSFGVEQASSPRYSTAGLLFWLALIVVATMWLRHRDARLRVAAMAAVLPLLLGLAYYQRSFLGVGRAWALPRLEATTALLANVDDAEALARVYPDASVPKDRAHLLRERHLSIFADEWSNWLGTPLTDHARLGDPAQCRGSIDGAGTIGATDHHGWRANGWVWDPAHWQVPQRVVIADVSGRVVGYGLAEFAKGIGGRGANWHGHFLIGQPGLVSAFALLDNGRTACPLGSFPVAP